MIDIRTILNGYWWDASGKFEAITKEKDSLKELTVQITDRCNKNCVKCNKRSFTYQDMSREDVLRIIREACDLGLKHIHFTGGEPTLHKNFPKFIEVSKDLGLRVDMSTNGEFSEVVADELVSAGIDSINISWDYINLPPKCIEFIGMKPIKIFVNHMVIPENYWELPDFLEHVAKYVEITDIQLMPPRGGAQKFTMDQIAEFNTEIRHECYKIALGRFPMVAYKIHEILANTRASDGIYHEKIDWPCHRSKAELRAGAKGFTTCTYLYRDGHITCGLDCSVKEAWEKCKTECAASIPPIPSMCDHSCSPEVCYFNYYVEQELRSQ